MPVQGDWVAHDFRFHADGPRAKFPRYNYDDMVLAQYRPVTEGLGVKHLRLVLGNSMGGMQAWIRAVRYPDFVDAVVPMACLRVAIRAQSAGAGALTKNGRRGFAYGARARRRQGAPASRAATKSCTIAESTSAAE